MRIRNEKGFGLIEIMISMVLGLLITMAVTRFYVDSQHASRYERELSQLHESERSLIMLQGRDFRGADFWGCFNPDYGLVSFANQLNPGRTGFITISRGVFAEKGSGPNGSDAISVNTGIPVSSRLIAPFMADKTSDIRVDTASDIAKDDVLVVTDCRQADVFQVTNDPTASNLISHVMSLGSPGNKSDSLSSVYATDAVLFKPQFVRWFIAPNDTDTALFRSVNSGTPELVAPHVEKMIIDYNTLATGLATGVTLSIVLRSAHEVALKPITYTFAGASITPADRYLRLPLTFSFALRNRLP